MGVEVGGGGQRTSSIMHVLPLPGEELGLDKVAFPPVN